MDELPSVPVAAATLLDAVDPVAGVAATLPIAVDPLPVVPLLVPVGPDWLRAAKRFCKKAWTAASGACDVCVELVDEVELVATVLGEVVEEAVVPPDKLNRLGDIINEV